jgi:isopropylmalate/homocitrate/citramalate synthase
MNSAGPKAPFPDRSFLMNPGDESGLIHDWAQAGPRKAHYPRHVMLNDETLRDGLQSPSVSDPALETKVQLLHLMEDLGIETADVGLPGAGAHQREAVLRLCREISDQRLHLKPNCAARTLMVDIQPIAEVTQLSGVAIEACVFIGSSPIRQYAEEWDLSDVVRHTRESIGLAVRESLPVMYVTEDTVRSSPEHLRVLLTTAVEAGAKRLCLCDTCGAATPQGVWNLVTWVRLLVKELGADVGLDWHGHRDRGLDLANSLAAIEAGATRVHGTALGIGERVGNTPMEQLLVNLKLLGIRDDDLSRLPDYVRLASDATGVPMPINMPIVGRDAFRTATGVHASAIIKARKKGDAWLADRVYSGVPAAWIGRTQEIEVGPMSGMSNVVCYLSERDLPSTPKIVKAILDLAKRSSRVLTESEILEVLRDMIAPAS